MKKLTLENLAELAPEINRTEGLPSEYATHMQCGACNHVQTLGAPYDEDEECACDVCGNDWLDPLAVVKLESRDDVAHIEGMDDWVADKTVLGGGIYLEVNCG